MNNINDKFEMFFDKSFNIAVVGLSPNEERTSHRVAKQLIKRGFNIIPVYPKEEEILDRKVYRNIKDIPVKVDVVIFFLRPELLFPIVKEAVEVGIDKLWLQEKVSSPETAEYAEEHNISYVMDKCFFKAHVQFEKENK